MRRALFLLLSFLLVLTACSQHTVSEGTHQNQDDAGDPDTLLSYDRDSVIARNETMNGTFTDTSVWASDYCLNSYPEHDVVKCEFESGFVSPDTYMSGGGICGSVIWNVDLSSGDTRKIQVIYVEYDGVLTLCGVFEGDSVMTSRPAVYTFVAADPRFASLCTYFPKISSTLFENVLSLNVQSIESILMPDSDTLLAVDILSYGYDGSEPAICLHFFSVSSKSELRRVEIKGYSYYDSSVSDGVVSILLRADLHVYKPTHEYRIGATGEGKLTELSDKSVYRLSPSVSVVSDESGISVNGETVLPVKGEYTEISLPVFFSALDGHRFIYYNGGWEWTWSVCIYDVETKTSTELFGEGYIPIACVGSKLYTVYDRYDICGNLWETDLETFDSRQVLDKRTDDADTEISDFKISPDGKTVTAIRIDNQTHEETLEIYSTETGKLTVKKPLDLRSGYCKNIYFLGIEPALLFHRYDTDSDVLLW